MTNDDPEPLEPPAALTPADTSVILLCEQFTATKRMVETWTLLAVAVGVPLDKIQSAGKIAEQLQAWCEQYGPWDLTRPRRG